jgi:hypothetical protein
MVERDLESAHAIDPPPFKNCCHCCARMGGTRERGSRECDSTFSSLYGVPFEVPLYASGRCPHSIQMSSVREDQVSHRILRLSCQTLSSSMPSQKALCRHHHQLALRFGARDQVEVHTDRRNVDAETGLLNSIAFLIPQFPHAPSQYPNQIEFLSGSNVEFSLRSGRHPSLGLVDYYMSQAIQLSNSAGCTIQGRNAEPAQSCSRSE